MENNELNHYGVLGMRWGHHNSSGGSGSSKGHSKGSKKKGNLGRKITGGAAIVAGLGLAMSGMSLNQGPAASMGKMYGGMALATVGAMRMTSPNDNKK